MISNLFLNSDRKKIPAERRIVTIFTAMKALALFMTIFILLTGFDFCEEDVLVNRKPATEHLKKATDQQDKNDNCTALCQCARCSFSILLSADPNDITSSDLKNSKFIPVLSGTPVQVSPSVWQPPKTAS